MRRRLRLLALAFTLVRRSPGKFFMAVGLITGCVVTFLGVQAIAAASSSSLDASVRNTLGTTGEYRVDVSSAVGLPVGDLDAPVERALRTFSREPAVLIDNLGAAPLDCSATGNLGTQNLYVLRAADGQPLPPSNPTFDAGQVCLGGVDISQYSHAVPQAQRVALGTGIILDAAVERSAQLTVGQPLARSFLITTGQQADMTGIIQSAVVAALNGPAALNGEIAETLVQVQRVDLGADVRRAARGVHLVYALVAWAILLIGGVGVLITEMSNVRERNWLYGLARAMGATRLDVAALVTVDAAMVLLSGFLLASLAAIAGTPTIESFGRANFKQTLSLLDKHESTQLLVSLVVLLAVGAVLPARRAARLDPVDILERR